MSTSILKELIQLGASVTVKANQTHTVVIARMPDGETYKATGPSPDIALERCLEKTEKHSKNIKKMRRQKERARQEIMEASLSSNDDDEDEDTIVEERDYSWLVRQQILS